MAEQILIRNQMKMTDGGLEPFSAAARRAIDFVVKNGPQPVVRTYIDEEDMRAVSFQLYRASADVLRHWNLSVPISDPFPSIARPRGSRFMVSRMNRSWRACPASSLMDSG